MITEDWFFSIALLTFISMAVSWILFGRISMARIEKEIQKDGLPRPASWDGLGARAVWYSCAIVIPLGTWNGPSNSFFDVTKARKYAKPIDKTLGLAMLISAFSFVFIAVFGSFVLKLY